MVFPLQRAKIDIRVISAASADLQLALKEERIRSDLYFRLNTVELVIPSLRDRDDDALLLFKHFANNRASLQHQVLAFEKSMVEFALSQSSGNIAETCEYLGIPRRTLNDKLIRHEIDKTLYLS